MTRQELIRHISHYMATQFLDDDEGGYAFCLRQAEAALQAIEEAGLDIVAKDRHETKEDNSTK